jgi:hypothetical protein
MKSSKQLLVTMPWGEHILLSDFLDSNVRKLWSKLVNIQALPPQVFFECKGIRNLFLQAK